MANNVGGWLIGAGAALGGLWAYATLTKPKFKVGDRLRFISGETATVIGSMKRPDGQFWLVDWDVTQLSDSLFDEKSLLQMTTKIR